VAARPGSSGRAGYFARVRLVAPHEHASPEEVVAPGGQGQLIVSMESPEAFGGYWRRPDADPKAIRDGWYYTGDLAVRDEAGDLHYQGRVDDMINFGGENIHPAEIEAELARCPVVSEVAVAGVPDPKWGQLVTAFVVPGVDVLLPPEQTAREVRAFVRQRASLPVLKRPKRVVVVERLPRSAAGKLLRRQLIAGATDDHHGQPATDHR
jgi:2-furoate---CoA ligase